MMVSERRDNFRKRVLGEKYISSIMCENSGMPPLPPFPTLMHPALVNLWFDPGKTEKKTEWGVLGP